MESALLIGAAVEDGEVARNWAIGQDFWCPVWNGLMLKWR